MFDDYGIESIQSFASRHQLVQDNSRTIKRVHQIDTGLDDAPIHLLYRFADDHNVALAFEKAIPGIFTAHYVADRIAITWGNEMD